MVVCGCSNEDLMAEMKMKRGARIVGIDNMQKCLSLSSISFALWSLNVLNQILFCILSC